MTTKPNEPEALSDALARARRWLETASDAEKKAMWEAQRESWSKGPHGPTDGMGTVIIPAQPVADAGGVTAADRQTYAGVHLQSTGDKDAASDILQGVDDDDMAMGIITRHRLQSVAAATAAKDAEIARLRGGAGNGGCRHRRVLSILDWWRNARLIRR